MKLAPGWALIQVNFDPIQEIGQKVGDALSFARLQYMSLADYKRALKEEGWVVK